ncbi:hypothetical protein Q4575_17470 [Psychrosphaera sp. 1_MG-2023]|uniref:AAA family ATPase n=1 Tax=Psychrosphaera sp. 1_MG-2023 TaxID=3062643 RepID=UPI0026E27DD2|nr:AAA family ATPase [Psychrosphaera sp. 1_MG-2023]MDO6721205.1 hypothetical protein [Psychrosphaera sp. 1_MG-2023]
MTALGSNFYFPPSRLNYLVQLRSLLTQNKIVALEGGMGFGKTVLLEEVLTTAMPDANKCYVTASKNITDVQLRSRIIEQLFGNVLFDPEKPLVSSFLEFNQQTELMVAIDNAHYMSAKLVGELLQVFSQINGAGIQFSIVLSFDKSISATLLNINSQLIAVESIPRLSKDESYHLLNTYFSELPAITDSKLKRWIENSKGVPIQLLAYNDQNNLELVNSGGLNIKLWGAIVTLASLLLALGIYAYNVGYFDSTPNVAKQHIGPEDDESLAVKQVLNANKKVSIPEFKSRTLYADDLAATRTASAEEMFTALQASLDDPASVITPQTKPDKGGNAEDSAKVTGTTSVKSTPSLATNTPPTVKKQSVENQLSKSAAAAKQVVNDSDLIIATASENYPEQPQPSLYKIDNDAFMSLPKDRYVLQFTAVSSEPTLAEYLVSAPVKPSEFRIYKIQRNGTDWIVVTYGLFDTITQAREVASRLEPNAWAKSVSVIQQQIQTYNQRFEKAE